MKKIIFALSLFAGTVYAQQKAQYTQYMINPFLLNPAVSGTEDYTDLRVGYRKQWAGFEGAPRTMYFSGHTNFGKSKAVNNRSKYKKDGFHGAGVIVNNDAIGPSTSNTITAAYSYHLTLAKKLYASFGANGGVNFLSMDAAVLRTANPDDPSITGYNATSLADANAGFWIYSDKFYAGASMNQVLGQKLYDANAAAVVKGKLAHHYYVMAGYRIPVNHDWTFIPSFLMKAVAPAPISFDLNAKARYRNMAWLGLSYRNRDAIAALLGVVISNTVDIGYSYDFTTSSIRKYSSGSHEVVVGVRIKPRQQVICPSHFW